VVVEQRADPADVTQAAGASEAPGESLLSSEADRQLQLLTEALNADDAETGASAMIALYGRPMLEGGPLPPAAFCLETILVLLERNRVEQARALLKAFDDFAHQHGVAGLRRRLRSRRALRRRLSWRACPCVPPPRPAGQSPWLLGRSSWRQFPAVRSASQGIKCRSNWNSAIDGDCCTERRALGKSLPGR
jgi:hypothetical protein